MHNIIAFQSSLGSLLCTYFAHKMIVCVWVRKIVLTNKAVLKIFRLRLDCSQFARVTHDTGFIYMYSFKVKRLVYKQIQTNRVSNCKKYTALRTAVWCKGLSELSCAILESFNILCDLWSKIIHLIKSGLHTDIVVESM